MLLDAHRQGKLLAAIFTTIIIRWHSELLLYLLPHQSNITLLHQVFRH
jgi:hypothetical protein